MPISMIRSSIWRRATKKIVLPNLARSRELILDLALAQPLALLAVALRHETRYYGVSGRI